MAITQKSRWDDVGVEPPAGEARYVAGEQPIAEYDNWFNKAVVDDIAALNAYLDSLGLANGVLTKDIDANGFGIHNVGGMTLQGDVLANFSRIRKAIGWPVQYDGRAVSFIIPGFRDVLYCAIDRGLSVTVNREPDSGSLADMFRFASKSQSSGAKWNNVSDTNPVQIEIDIGYAYIDVIVIEFGWRNRLAIDYTIELYHDRDGDGTYVWETLVDVVGNSAYVVAHEVRLWRVKTIRITVTKAGEGDAAGILHIANIQALSSEHGVGFPHCLSVLGGIMYGTINAQDMLPKSDNTYNLGSASARWANIHGVNVYGNPIKPCQHNHLK